MQSLEQLLGTFVEDGHVVHAFLRRAAALVKPHQHLRHGRHLTHQRLYLGRGNRLLATRAPAT
jgi:hypothetical protein